ncbi:MAG: hypothetical protein WC718_05340 [Phycisphaerales bacterium]|jgi:hypothetical protein
MKLADNPALRGKLKVGAIIAAMVIGAWYGYTTVYATPRARLQESMNTELAAAQSLQETLKGEKEIKARIKAMGPTFLADKFDVLSARFRDGLTRLASTAGLSEVVVEHGQPQGVSSPLLKAKGMPTTLKRPLTKTPDFEVVHGSLQGSGTLEQAYAALAAAQCQPWIHRVEGFDLEPVGKERERFKVRINVATVLAPAWAAPAAGSAELAVTPTNPETLQLAAALSRRNVFRKPPPEQAAAVQVARSGDPAAPAVAFVPYEDWRLTGVARGKDGPEAMFLNTRTNAKVSVLKGGHVLDATLIDAADERVLIDINGARFELTSGQTLASRKPSGT